MVKRAIVLIHGHMGTPRQFDDLIALIKDHGADLVALTLPGHDAPIAEFARAGRIDWISYVERRLNDLRDRYDELILVGHSMGGLLSIDACVRNPDQIKAIVAVALPLYVRITGKWLQMRVRFVGKPKETDDPALIFARKMCGVRGITATNAYRLTPSVLEFLRLMRATRALLPRLAVPLIVLNAENDEIVSPRSAELALKYGARVTTLQKASHFWFPEDETKIIFGAICAALCEAAT